MTRILIFFSVFYTSFPLGLPSLTCKTVARESMSSLIPSTPSAETDNAGTKSTRGKEYNFLNTAFEHSRHWSSLQQHANQSQAAVLPSELSTPRPKLRREGFAWEEDIIIVAKELAGLDQIREPSPLDPHEKFDLSDEAPRASISEPPWRASARSKKLSSEESLTSRQSRKGTGRSSISSMARGILKGLPDTRMFNLQADQSTANGPNDDGQLLRPSVLRTRTSFEIPGVKKDQAPMKSEVDQPERASSKKVKSHSSLLAGGGIKERRKVNEHSHTLKIPMPFRMPDLPARSRSPFPPPGPLTALPSTRSPKTQYINGIPQSVFTPTLALPTPQGTPPTTRHQNEDQLGNSQGKARDSDTPEISPLTEKPGERPGHFRSPSSKSIIQRAIGARGESSNARSRTDLPGTPEASRATTPDSIQSKRLNKHWPWNYSETGTTGSAINTSSRDKPREPRGSPGNIFKKPFRSNKRCAMDSPILGPKKKRTSISNASAADHGRNPSLVSTTSGLGHTTKKRLRSIFSKSDKHIHSPRVTDFPLMSADTRSSFAFQPPEMNRIQTPQMYTTPTYATPTYATPTYTPSIYTPPMHTLPIHTPPIFNTEGSQEIGAFFDYQRTGGGTPGGVWDSDALLMSQAQIDPSSSDSESPQAPDFTAPPPSSAPTIPSEQDWFRVKLAPVDNDYECRNSVHDFAREMFEWDLPEHLPGSPLCPLNPKHKSGGKGICVYHGRKKEVKGDMADGAGAWALGSKRSW
ncbi:hypothetical protein K432DRAFT_3948 [Lepidopterella palustris CBS 459.81]|uniref:Uncharacterized protein n=1 Tax=Lepidopterella palustris CBS 459.81 TaxID=1314670 RepID=A0A8E2EDP6_9PEZI|nr:hypothetical protein K432DRAFT_3948 [Lepidopterella palustris CBS 459.81]